MTHSRVWARNQVAMNEILMRAGPAARAGSLQWMSCTGLAQLSHSEAAVIQHSAPHNWHSHNTVAPLSLMSRCHAVTLAARGTCPRDILVCAPVPCACEPSQWATEVTLAGCARSARPGLCLEPWRPGHTRLLQCHACHAARERLSRSHATSHHDSSKRGSAVWAGPSPVTFEYSMD